MSSKTPLVSIVVVNFNGKKLLKKCLDSLLAINYPHNRTELIVVDNGSVDGSVKFIKDKYNKIKILENKVNNYCKACNMGILASRGDFIVLLNNDVRVTKNWLLELIKVIKSKPAVGALTSKLLKKDGTIQNAGLVELPNFYWDERGAGRSAKDKNFNSITQVDAICGACVLYRKSALKEIGLLDEDFVMFSEDVDLSLRLKKRGWELVYVPESVAYHDAHGSCDEDFARQRIEKNRLLLIAKYYPYKLANALVGNEYFVVKPGVQESGILFNLVQDIIFKLIKEHDKAVAFEAIKEVLDELRRIASYENKELENELKKILDDLIETRKDREHYRAKESEYDEQLQITKEELKEYDGEISNLSEKLKLSLDKNLSKDGLLLEKASQLDELSQELNAYRQEASNLANKLKDALNDNSLKGSQLDELAQELNAYRQEASNLATKLKDALNDNSLKASQLDELAQELNAYRQEASNLATKLKDALNDNSLKDSNIYQLNEELKSHKEEIVNLAEKLKVSLNDVLARDNIILEKNKELEAASSKGEQTLKQLENVYNSEGVRFILNPLWNIISFMRLASKYLIKKGCGVIWAAVALFLTPLVVTQVIFFAIERLAEILLGPAEKVFIKKRRIVNFERLTVSIVIPNFNGIDILRKCLASIYEADGFKDSHHEVLVVDDASSYGIAECIKDDFPFVRVIRNKHNQGFGRSCNRGISQAKGELIVLLNNDIMVSRDFLEPLKKHFKDELVFSVSPKLYCWDMKTFNYGMHMGKFKDGYLNLWNEAETGNGDKVSQTSPTIFSVGGAMCFRKSDFQWLGGFDDIYRPNCWEDIDISYRAQKRGLKVLYEPQSLMYHKGAATLNYVRHKEIKNELLFMWKNLSQANMLLSHLNQLTRLLRYGKHSSRTAFLRGYLWAFDYLISALIHRFQEAKYIKVSDTEILNKCMLYYRNFMRNNFKHTEKKNILVVTPFLIYPLNSGGKLRIYNLYKRLARNYNLILLSLIHDEAEKEYALHLKDIFKEVHLVHTKTTSNEILFPQMYKYSFSNFLIDKLKEIQENSQLDLVQIESNELLYLGKYIKYIPIVYTEHDISMLSLRKSYYKRAHGHFFSDLIDHLKVVCYHNRMYSRIDRVITLSKEDRKVIRAFSPETAISLVPTGVDLKHFVFTEKAGKSKTLVFVGHYPHYPNEEAAVYFCREIFPLIKKKLPEIKLKLVGSAPSQEVLSLSKIDGVEVIGEVEDVNPYLQEASVFVCPFKRSAGIKGKVLEAMATGTPVVSTSRGSYGIDAINGSSILIADKPSNFARHIIELLNNEELYKNIAHNARVLAEKKYDWDRIAQQLGVIYEDVTGGYYHRQNVKDDHNKQQVESVADNHKIRTIIGKVDDIVESSLGFFSADNIERPVLHPEELHIELTHACNSRCITCDIWDFHQRTNKGVGDELTLGEIRSSLANAKRLRDIKTVVLSGGEPFLRTDFVDICTCIKEFFPHASIGILTNGLKTEMIINKIRAVLDKTGSNSLWIGTSLDGLNDAYDKMRGIKGGFTNFVNTIERFKKEFPQIPVSCTFVFTPFNIEQLIPCWEFAQNYGLNFFAQFAVSKQARKAEVFKWQERDLEKIRRHIDKIIGRMISEYAQPDLFEKSLDKIGDKINLLTRIYYWAHLVDFQQTGKRFAHNCSAASKFSMLDPYGNLFFCPLLKDKTIGNVRDNGIDELWDSKEAASVRNFIKSGGCSCWLVCTVFPIVGNALSLYGDKVARNLAIRTSHRKINVNAEFIKKPNLELNNEEFGDKKIALRSGPQGITIGTNYSCNANCVFCLEGEYKPFSFQLYKEYFQPQLGHMLTEAAHVSFCGMGELLLVPGVEDFLKFINITLSDKNKILTTNGIALKKDLLDIFQDSKYSIQISLHASNAALHERITGVKGAFDKIIEQVWHITKNRKNRQSPHITLVFLVTTLNIEDLPNFIELAASLDVDCVQCNYLTVFNVAHVKLSCFFMQEVTNEIFNKASRRAQDLKVPLILPPRFSSNDYFKTICSEPWKNIYVDTHGAVLPCCYSGKHFGGLEVDEISSIWNNNMYQSLRKELALGDNNGMCKYCLNNDPNNVNLFNAHVSFRPQVQELILNQKK